MVNSAPTSVTDSKTCIRGCSAACWTALATLLVAAAGCWPTYVLSGIGGVKALIAAGVIVGGVGCMAISIVIAMVPEGGGRLALAYIVSGMAKALACGALGLVGAIVLPVNVVALLIWIVLFYMAVLVVQILWLIKKIRQGSR